MIMTQSFRKMFFLFLLLLFLPLFSSVSSLTFTGNVVDDFGPARVSGTSEQFASGTYPVLVVADGSVSDVTVPPGWASPSGFDIQDVSSFCVVLCAGRFH